MMTWLLVFSLLLSSKTPSPLPLSRETAQPVVSVFDVRRESVAKTFPLTPRLSRWVVDALDDSPSAYGGYALDPKSGWIVRVPFAAPATARSPLYDDRIKLTYLFLEPGKSVKALIFYETSRKISIAELRVAPERVALAFGIRLAVRPAPLPDQDHDEHENRDAQRIHDPSRVPDL